MAINQQKPLSIMVVKNVATNHTLINHEPFLTTINHHEALPLTIINNLTIINSPVLTINDASSTPVPSLTMAINHHSPWFHIVINHSEASFIDPPLDQSLRPVFRT